MANNFSCTVLASAIIGLELLEVIFLSSSFGIFSRAADNKSVAFLSLLILVAFTNPMGESYVLGKGIIAF